jgi:hypothetical protein
MRLTEDDEEYRDGEVIRHDCYRYRFMEILQILYNNEGTKRRDDWKSFSGSAYNWRTAFNDGAMGVVSSPNIQSHTEILPKHVDSDFTWQENFLPTPLI